MQTRKSDLDKNQVSSELQELVGTFLRETPYLAEHLPIGAAPDVMLKIVGILWNAMNENLEAKSAIRVIKAALCVQPKAVPNQHY